ncbi:MAG: chemotaxis response regulator protein-glutamate methylesterase [Ignavibacteriales bacterium]|nr:chemotaxis response regulator protein-glutamate methylesterase [Ignavibacteriales bacterium]
MINVVVVDDSAFMRKSLTMMLESDPQIKVVATARDGREGIEKIRQFNPDVITLDIEMPGMDGLTALGIIMKEMPRPVLMVSSLTSEGAKATIDALNLGAVDFIPKELSYVSLNIVKIKEELIEKVKNIAHSKAMQFRLQRIKGLRPDATKKSPAAASVSASDVKIPPKNFRALVIGVSTGGPFALLQVIPKLSGKFPLGIVVVQHMPPHFTKSLGERLNSLSEVTVKEAEHGEKIEPGTVLIAPGGSHLTFEKNGTGIPRVKISSEPSNTLYRPCVDVMVGSAVETYNAPLLGLIMTGMGKDGLQGLKLVRQKGGYVIAQNEETCVVYGMPKAVVDAGIADAVIGLDEIPFVLNQLVPGK